MPIILSIPIFNQAQGVFVLTEMSLDFMVKGSPRAVVDVVMDEIFSQKFRPESSDPIAFTNARFAASILYGVSDLLLAFTKREHTLAMSVHFHYHQSLAQPQPPPQEELKDLLPLKRDRSDPPQPTKPERPRRALPSRRVRYQRVLKGRETLRLNAEKLEAEARARRAWGGGRAEKKAEKKKRAEARKEAEELKKRLDAKNKAK